VGINSLRPKDSEKLIMETKPFRAFRFDANVVGDLDNCIAPPYDVISSAQQKQLYERSRYNIVRIIKGETRPSDDGQNNQYTRAAEYFKSWVQESALKQDATEAIYAYVQDFELAGAEFQRLSFIALGKLEDFGKTVRPHEEIFEKPMIDRLNLKKATEARFGLVFMLYEDEERIADKIIEKSATQEPLLDCINDDNVRHRIFAITAKEDINSIVRMMNDKSCIIADGHHRYTTGLTYAKECPKAEAKYQMLAFSNMRQKGLTVLATHRIVGNLQDFNMEKLIKDLRQNFELSQWRFNAEPKSKTEAKHKMLAQMITEHYKDRNAFGIYGGGNTFYIAVLKDKREMDTAAPDMSPAWRGLDVSILHKLILEQLLGISEEKLSKGEHVEYVKDTTNAVDNTIAQVDSKQKQIAFFLNPVKLEQLKMVTEAGERMPQKSTYFYPKMYTGLTIQKL